MKKIIYYTRIRLNEIADDIIEYLGYDRSDLTIIDLDNKITVFRETAKEAFLIFSLDCYGKLIEGNIFKKNIKKYLQFKNKCL